MSISISGFEQKFFRKINDVVEPLVSSGVGSPAWTPVSLIVLESTGFKSGQPRRTPLWSLRLGRYRLISVRRQPTWDQWARFLRDTFLPVASPV